VQIELIVLGYGEADAPCSSSVEVDLLRLIEADTRGV
jgi:hypothetical protein